MMEQTLTILKPDTVQSGNAGAVISMMEDKGFQILAAKMLHLSRWEAEGFYAVHRNKAFFDDLISFMTESPVIVMILGAENAVQRLRELMGSTDPSRAVEGTIRHRFGTNIERNAVHGSDALETAALETAYFFSQIETFRQLS